MIMKRNTARGGNKSEIIIVRGEMAMSEDEHNGFGISDSHAELYENKEPYAQRELNGATQLTDCD